MNEYPNIFDDSIKPREKIQSYGTKNLTDLELLQAIIGNGSKSNDVKKLSIEVLKLFNTYNDNVTINTLSEIKGIGTAKASLICAAIEFARRRIRPEGTKIRNASDAFSVIRHFAFQKNQEYFIAITLNGAHEVIKTRVITIGLLNSTQVHPREVFVDAISDRAASIIVAHNHPSGSLEPSSEDLKITDILEKAGKLIGIKVLDHIIFTCSNFFSLRNN